MDPYSHLIALPNRSRAADYAVFTNDMHALNNREEFEHFILENGERVLFYATPEMDKFAWFGEVHPGTLITHRPGLASADARKRWWSYLHYFLSANKLFAPLLLVGMVVAALIATYDIALGQAGMGGILLVAYGLQWARTRWMRAIPFLRPATRPNGQEVLGYKFTIWLWRTSVNNLRVVPILLVAIFVGQLVYGFEASINEFGLVKESFREGEYWRAITAGFLHGGILHIYFNASALYYLSNLLLRFANWGWFALVYSVALIGGSLASVWYLPEATSVGASGAILGLLGFILVLSIRFRDIFPRSFLTENIFWVALIVVYGLVGSSFIDNAGHAGGVLAGGLIGLLPSRASVLRRIQTLSDRVPRRPSHTEEQP